METPEVQEATMRSLRVALMNTVFGVRNKEISANDAIAIAKVGTVMVDSYNADIDAVRAADALKDRNIGLQKVLDLDVVNHTRAIAQ